MYKITARSANDYVEIWPFTERNEAYIEAIKMIPLDYIWETHEQIKRRNNFADSIVKPI